MITATIYLLRRSLIFCPCFGRLIMANLYTRYLHLTIALVFSIFDVLTTYLLLNLLYHLSFFQ